MPGEIESADVSRIRKHYLCRDTSEATKRRYGISVRGNVLLIEELQRQMKLLISSQIGAELNTKVIIDVGCGTGYWLRQFIQWGAQPGNLAGIDLVPARVAKARQLCPSGVRLECGDASTLPFDSSTFDLAFQATVFTSILDLRVKRAIANEILRVLKPRGRVLWYDYFISNPCNHDARGVPKHEILGLFPGCKICFKRVTLAPPIGRIVGKFSPLAYKVLSTTKIFSTHYLGFIDKI